MEQSTQTINNNHERVKKKLGRPKGTGTFTDEENKERARPRSILYYYLNLKRKENENDYNIMQKEMMFKIIYMLTCMFPNFHLNNWQTRYIYIYIYIIGELQNLYSLALDKSE